MLTSHAGAVMDRTPYGRETIPNSTQARENLIRSKPGRVIVNCGGNHQLIRLRSFEKTMDAGSNRFCRSDQCARQHGFGLNLFSRRPIGLNVIDWSPEPPTC